jgi:nitroreductase
MKKVFITITALFCAALSIYAQGTDTAADKIVHHYAARDFIAGSISSAQLNTVLAAGVNAPSAMNRQPWQFTVVQNQGLAKQIISNVVDGNVLIIVSADVGKNDTSIYLDCGLAEQSMYLAAQAIGLGSRIYTGPMRDLNGKLKNELPKGHTAVALVRIGQVKAVDAVSAASNRKDAGKVITHK